MESGLNSLKRVTIFLLMFLIGLGPIFAVWASGNDQHMPCLHEWDEEDQSHNSPSHRLRKKEKKLDTRSQQLHATESLGSPTLKTARHEGNARKVAQFLIK